MDIGIFQNPTGTGSGRHAVMYNNVKIDVKLNQNKEEKKNMLRPTFFPKWKSIIPKTEKIFLLNFCRSSVLWT